MSSLTMLRSTGEHGYSFRSVENRATCSKKISHGNNHSNHDTTAASLHRCPSESWNRWHEEHRKEVKSWRYLIVFPLSTLTCKTQNLWKLEILIHTDANYSSHLVGLVVTSCLSVGRGNRREEAATLLQKLKNFYCVSYSNVHLRSFGIFCLCSSLNTLSRRSKAKHFFLSWKYKLNLNHFSFLRLTLFFFPLACYVFECCLLALLHRWTGGRGDSRE